MSRAPAARTSLPPAAAPHGRDEPPSRAARPRARSSPHRRRLCPEGPPAALSPPAPPRRPLPRRPVRPLSPVTAAPLPPQGPPGGGIPLPPSLPSLADARGVVPVTHFVTVPPRRFAPGGGRFGRLAEVTEGFGVDG